MGIDIWVEQNDEGALRQLQEVWSGVDRGDAGYLREAYHGEPYATHFLLPEIFNGNESVKIPSHTLRGRLPRTLEIAEERERLLYGETSEEEIAKVKRSFVDFVELCEDLERRNGQPPTICGWW